MKKGINKMVEKSPNSKGEVFHFPATDGFEAVSIQASSLEDALLKLKELRK